MLEMVVEGPILIAPMEDGVQGARILAVQASSAIIFNVRIGPELAADLAEKLTMDDEDLAEQLRDDQIEAERAARLILPQNGSQN